SEPTSMSTHSSNTGAAIKTRKNSKGTLPPLDENLDMGVILQIATSLDPHSPGLLLVKLHESLSRYALRWRPLFAYTVTAICDKTIIPVVASHQERILVVVYLVPEGRVATYGLVAQLAGLGRAARLVGSTLRKLPEDSRLPWHRV